MAKDVLSVLNLRSLSVPLSALVQSPLRGRFVLPLNFGIISAPDSDPGAGVLSINGNTHANTTILRIDDLGSDGVSHRALFAELAVRDSIVVSTASNPAQWALYNVSAVAQPSGYSNVSVKYVAGPGGYGGALSVSIAWAEDTRFGVVQTITLSAGTYHNVEIDVRARLVEIVPTGDVFITGFKLVAGPVAPPGTGGVAPANGNAGGYFGLCVHGFGGRVILLNVTGSAAANQLHTPNVVDFVLQHAASAVELAYTTSYSRWSVLARCVGQLLHVPSGSGWTRDILAVNDGPGIVTTPGDNPSLRATNLTIGLRSGIEILGFAPGTYTLNLLATTAWVYIDITGSAGDVIIDAIIVAGGNVGARVVIARNSGTGRVILKNNAAKGANQITPPGPPPGDYYLTEVLAAVSVLHNSFSWCLADRQNTNETLAPLAPGRMLGLQIDAPAAATPQPLTGLEIGELFRRDFYAAYTLAPGGGSGAGGEYTETDISMDARVSQLYITPNADGDVRIRRMKHGASNQGVELQIIKEGIAGRVVIVDNNDSTHSFWTPGSIDFALTKYNDSIEVRHINDRWKMKQPAVCRGNLGALGSNGEAVPFIKRVAFSASGAAGTFIDVTVWNANAPAARILEGALRVDAVFEGDCALRTATGGGGSVVLPNADDTSMTFSSAVLGRQQDNARATATLAAGASLYLRVDRSVTGELLLECVRQ